MPEKSDLPQGTLDLLILNGRIGGVGGGACIGAVGGGNAADRAVDFRDYDFVVGGGCVVREFCTGAAGEQSGPDEGVAAGVGVGSCPAKSMAADERG
jgi:hypothetical protein